MAKETVNILKDKIDIVELLAQLNAALSEEWLAFYQYWVGSFVVEGGRQLLWVCVGYIAGYTPGSEGVG